MFGDLVELEKARQLVYLQSQRIQIFREEMMCSAIYLGMYF